MSDDVMVVLVSPRSTPLLDLLDTGRTLHRYHAWVCGFRSGVTSPELLIMLSYGCLEMF